MQRLVVEFKFLTIYDIRTYLYVKRKGGRMEIVFNHSAAIVPYRLKEK